mgnify:CR=1 FL=1
MGEPSFALVLYIPDAALQSLRETPALRGVLLDGVGELDFIPQPWWETSYTARLQVIQSFEPRTSARSAGPAPDGAPVNAVEM